MNIGFGVTMAVIGFVFIVMALVKLFTDKEILGYKWLRARSYMLWKGKTDYFYLCVGTIILVLGILWACGIIWEIA